MQIVIIAGGSGTRLWPLSTPSFPKHLLKINSDSSLIQNTLKRARKLAPDDSIYIYTEASHVEHVRDQLGDLKDDHILVEPARKGTANCVIFVMQHLKKIGISEDEAVVILWADHLIRDQQGFVDTFKRAALAAEKHKKVVFIGAEPRYASVGFGYIEHGEDYNGEKQIFEFKDFHEKPDKKTAEKYLSSGRYLWNMGYIVTTIKVFEDSAKKANKAYFKSYQKLLQSDDKQLEANYLKLKADALEYAYSEKLKEALVIPGSFDWVDVGSYSDLHYISFQDSEGNHISGENVAVENTSNSYISNELDTPVAVVGLDNVVVVNTKNGILVINKNFSQKVKDIATKFND